MKWHKLIASLASGMILVGILLTVVFTVCFDHSFYEQEYKANGQAEKIGMSQEDLMKSTDALLDYLQGKKDNIKVEAMMNGHNVEVFNERETLHMADVKELLDNAVKARDILLWGGAAILAAVIASAKREKFSVLKDAYKYSVAAIGAFIAVLGCWAAVDFYDFWVDFHYLFFDNTLFFLDPNTSIMINMFPENFFFDLVFRIIVIVIIIIAAIGGSIHWLSVLKRRRETKNDQCCSL